MIAVKMGQVAMTPWTSADTSTWPWREPFVDTNNKNYFSKRNNMEQSIIHVALVVRDYDEAIEFYCHKLNFVLVEDTYQPEQDKRWVVVKPASSNGTSLLLARAAQPVQEAFIGNQSGGRVFLFLSTDDFWRDYQQMLSAGIKFVRAPKQASYGTVAVFEDLYGNLWDLVEKKKEGVSG
jgi:catechol 2,3-dioxygenase-like lactoylglutathione lyase family enzyme